MQAPSVAIEDSPESGRRHVPSTHLFRTAAVLYLQSKFLFFMNLLSCSYTDMEVAKQVLVFGLTANIS